MKNDIDLSIIIVNYNTVDLTQTCLQSIIASKSGNYTIEIIVCDNGSADDSVGVIQKEFPGVLLIQNRRNVGFAAGNNIGMKKSKGRYILLLNSDTVVSKDTLYNMLTYMDEYTDAGVSTCKLFLPDGGIDPACHRGFPTPWASLTYMIGLERLFPGSRFFAQYHQGYKNLHTIHEVDCISGAFFMVRREVIQSAGFLDEAYFMYGEDLDWCYRIKKAGWKIFYNPSVSVLHKKKQSGRDSKYRMLRKKTNKYFYETMNLFYNKHYRYRYSWFVTGLVRVGITLKMMLR